MSGDGPTSEDYNRFSGDLLDNARSRLNPSFASVDFNESRAYSNYHGMSAQLQRRYSRGVAFQAAYTFMREGCPIERHGHRQSGSRLRLRQRRCRPQAGYELHRRDSLPTGGSDSARDAGRLAAQCDFDHAVGNALHGDLRLRRPRCDFNADGVNNDRVNLPNGTDLGDPSKQEWLSGVLNPADFTNPAPMTFANQPRNAFRGPGYKSVDLSLFKNVEFGGFNGRRSTVQIRVEAFNAFNWTNLNNPTSNTNSANFGRVTSARPMRVVQLGAVDLLNELSTAGAHD